MNNIELLQFIEKDEGCNKLTQQQTCPFCRAKDSRTPASRFRAMRAKGNGTQGYILRDWVAVGLEFLIAYGREVG